MVGPDSHSQTKGSKAYSKSGTDDAAPVLLDESVYGGVRAACSRLEFLPEGWSGSQ